LLSLEHKSTAINRAIPIAIGMARLPAKGIF
jgi:hypothetical protein